MLALIALLVPAGSALSEPATMTWPEAVAQLTAERTRAETCVALVKRYGDDAQTARGQLTYTNAKADADAVIAGLITALSAGQEPASLSSLQARLTSGVSGLAEFCNTVARLRPTQAGRKAVGLACWPALRRTRAPLNSCSRCCWPACRCFPPIIGPTTR